MAPVAHVVVFSELTPRARAQYTRLLLSHKVQFAKRPSDGRYLANVRLETPLSLSTVEVITARDSPRGVGASPSPRRRSHIDPTTPLTPSEELESDSEDEEAATNDRGDDSLDGDVPLRFRPFSAFLNEFGRRLLSRSSVGTYVTSESKLLRLINDIYDARADDALSSPTESIDDHQPMLFSGFVRVYLKSRFGLQSLVEQQALELLEGLVAHKSRLDIERFILFLSGQYQVATLTFFLKARDAAQEAVSSASALFRPTSAASARRRRSELDSGRRRQRRASTKATSSLVWMSKSQVETAAHQAFGSKNDDAYLQFAHQVRSYLAAREIQRPMQELLELQEFLSLALQTFVDLTHTPSAQRSTSLSSESGHQAHDGHDTVQTISPPPSPLPPPPLPRVFGSAVRMTAAVNQSMSENGRGGSEPQTRIRVHSSDGLARAQRYPMVQGVVHKTSAMEPPVAVSDDVQTRLSSLMARMQQRRSNG